MFFLEKKGGGILENYITIIGESVSEYTEKRSRFIATARHCDTEEEALAFIEEMRSKYWDARHNVFAYSVGNTARFSDDGEPHGTAGKPMLEVINGEELKNLAVVVTRYFGGILLGTGGLVRAYSKSTKDALSLASKAQMIPCTVFETACEYSDHAKLMKLLENSGAEINDTVFGADVKVTYSLKSEDTEPFCLSLTETFSARLKAEKIEEKISPFKIN